MKKFSRTPALIILAIALIAGVALAFTRPAPPGTDELTKAIRANTEDPEIWFQYAELIRQNKIPDTSAADAVYAYQRAIKLNCANTRVAHFGLGVSMALDAHGDPTGDNFFAFINNELIPADAKTALDVLDSPQAQSRKSNPKFAPAHKTADSQAVD
jgi:hypothetical protein